MKKILLIVGAELCTIQMITYLKQKNKKYINFLFNNLVIRLKLSCSLNIGKTKKI